MAGGKEDGDMVKEGELLRSGGMNVVWRVIGADVGLFDNAQLSCLCSSRGVGCACETV